MPLISFIIKNIKTKVILNDDRKQTKKEVNIAYICS